MKGFYSFTCALAFTLVCTFSAQSQNDESGKLRISEGERESMVKAILGYDPSKITIDVPQPYADYTTIPSAPVKWYVSGLYKYSDYSPNTIIIQEGLSEQQTVATDALLKRDGLKGYQPGDYYDNFKGGREVYPFLMEGSNLTDKKNDALAYYIYPDPDYYTADINTEDMTVRYTLSMTQFNADKSYTQHIDNSFCLPNIFHNNFYYGFYYAKGVVSGNKFSNRIYTDKNKRQSIIESMVRVEPLGDADADRTPVFTIFHDDSFDVFEYNKEGGSTTTRYTIPGVTGAGTQVPVGENSDMISVPVYWSTVRHDFDGDGRTDVLAFGHCGCPGHGEKYVSVFVPASNPADYKVNTIDYNKSDGTVNPDLSHMLYHYIPAMEIFAPVGVGETDYNLLIVLKCMGQNTQQSTYYGERYYYYSSLPIGSLSALWSQTGQTITFPTGSIKKLSDVGKNDFAFAAPIVKAAYLRGHANKPHILLDKNIYLPSDDGAELEQPVVYLNPGTSTIYEPLQAIAIQNLPATDEAGNSIINPNQSLIVAARSQYLDYENKYLKWYYLGPIDQRIYAVWWNAETNKLECKYLINNGFPIGTGTSQEQHGFQDYSLRICPFTPFGMRIKCVGSCVTATNPIIKYLMAIPPYDSSIDRSSLDIKTANIVCKLSEQNGKTEAFSKQITRTVGVSGGISILKTFKFGAGTTRTEKIWGESSSKNTSTTKTKGYDANTGYDAIVFSYFPTYRFDYKIIDSFDPTLVGQTITFFMGRGNDSNRLHDAIWRLDEYNKVVTGDKTMTIGKDIFPHTPGRLDGYRRVSGTATDDDIRALFPVKKDGFFMVGDEITVGSGGASISGLSMAESTTTGAGSTSVTTASEVNFGIDASLDEIGIPITLSIGGKMSWAETENWSMTNNWGREVSMEGRVPAVLNAAQSYNFRQVWYEYEHPESGNHFLISDWVMVDYFPTSDVENVEYDANADAPIEYYTMTGIKVNRPQPGQIYLMKQGNKVSKKILWR